MFARSYCAVRERLAYLWYLLTYRPPDIWTAADDKAARRWIEENTPWGEVQRGRTADGVNWEQRPLPFDQDEED